MTTTNTTPIHDLWNAMQDAGIQPDNIKIAGTIGVNYCFRPHEDTDHGIPASAWFRIRKEHALHILTGHAEAWLRGRGWSIQKNKYGVVYGDGTRSPGKKSLPDAIRAEAGRKQ